jgi:elongation factor P--beta-lysine ligase
LQVIDKVIALFDDELLKNFIEPNQFAHFIYQIIRSKHSSSIDVALKITRKVIDCSPIAYSVPIIREGVSKLIKDISTEELFKAFMGIGKDVDISDKSFDLDIHEVKEALHFTRVYNPDDHSMRDFYERRLLELVERQKHPGGPKDISSAPAGL